MWLGSLREVSTYGVACVASFPVPRKSFFAHPLRDFLLSPPIFAQPAGEKLFAHTGTLATQATYERVVCMAEVQLYWRL